MDGAGEESVAVVDQDMPPTVSLQCGKKEHVRYVGEQYYPIALVCYSLGLNPNFICSLQTDNGFRGMTLEEGGIGDVGEQAFPQEFLHQGNRAVVGLGGVPDVGEPFSLALSGGP